MSFSSNRHWCSLFQELLDLDPPWSVADAALDKEKQEMEVRLRCDSKVALACLACGASAVRYGTARHRRWRDLDTQGCATYVVAVEVKSGRDSGTRRGFDALREQHPEAEFLLVGGRGVLLEEFLATPPDHWVESHASGG